VGETIMSTPAKRNGKAGEGVARAKGTLVGDDAAEVGPQGRRED